MLLSLLLPSSNTPSSAASQAAAQAQAHETAARRRSNVVNALVRLAGPTGTRQRPDETVWDDGTDAEDPRYVSSSEIFSSATAFSTGRY